MDHVKKFVYTIVGCLTIVSLTFTICTKIGHCADSSSSVVTFSGELPFYFDSTFYESNIYTENLILSCVDDAINRYGNSYSTGSPVLVLSEFYGGNRVCVMFPTNRISVTLPSNSNNYIGSVAFTGTSVMFFYKSDGTYVSRTNSNNQKVYSVFTTSPSDGSIIYATNQHYAYQVLYVYNYENLLLNDVEVYTPLPEPEEPDPLPTDPHTKGGVLSNYIDSQTLIENSSEVNKVDDTPPSDSSSIPGWLQKILNGLGTINGSIQSGTLTIGDYIGQLKESVENAIAWITETPDSDEILDNVEPYLAENDLISGFLSSKTAIQGVYGSIGNVTAKTRSQMVWDIPFNLPSMSQTFHARIDFGWYENIRSTLEPFLNMFLCVTFLFSFLRSIPGILHGNSGEGDT